VRDLVSTSNSVEVTPWGDQPKSKSAVDRRRQGRGQHLEAVIRADVKVAIGLGLLDTSWRNRPSYGELGSV
jgi:hypothetical protein